ncbi:MAG TPA: ATP-binding protein [Pyrinomonadaceae bacterium]|jgi:signal transduction histidine kinase
MRLPNLFYSFRARLLLVLAALLVATLGVQYYLNRRAEQRVAVTIARQERALTAAIALALESIPRTDKYLEEIDKEHRIPLRTEHPSVMNILIVREDGRIDDSLDPTYKPTTLDDGSYRYFNISELKDLPRLVDAGHAADEINRLNRSSLPEAPPVAGESRAFPIRVPTSKGPNYIIISLGSAGSAGAPTGWQAARPLLPTLAVLLAATLAAAILVWRFTRPITGLSEAARRVAAGDFDFRVPEAGRRDEMGAFAANFNEMIARLWGTRELEARLNQAERSAVVGRLASAIAHEIRNPLNYINLTLDHLRTTLAPDDPKRRELVNRLTDQLKAEVARINKRISEFLSYTRPAELELRPLDLRASVADALQMVEVQAAESGIQTSIEQQGEIPAVVGDAESLRSVFTNLIINGLQAIEGEEGGRLTVRLSARDGRARVEISDTGRGIAPENLSQIFEPYFSTKETGTGLGLAIVKKAIDDHGGTISVESRQDEGTTFRVELPTAKGNDE